MTEFGTEQRFDDSDGERYGLVLPFDTDQPEFRRGFEVGNVWAHLHLEHGDREFMVHADNVEMLMRIGESLAISFAADIPCDGWVVVRYGAAAQEGAKR